MSVLVNFSIFPTDQGTSVSNEVAKVIEVISLSTYAYQLNAMSTVFETETMSQALDLIQKTYDVLKEHERVYLVVTMDIQKEKNGRIDSKVSSVKQKLGSSFHW